MAITYFGSAVVPADGAAATNAGPGPTAVTPPANMLLNDLLIVHQQYRGTGLEGSFGVSEAGGQSWHEIKQHGGTSISGALWVCRFNGTWSANPTFTSDSTLAHTIVPDVIRPSSTAQIIDIDVAPVIGSFVAGSTPFTKTITGITTLHNGAFVMAYWLTADDNTWDTLTGGWTNPGGVTQQRNTTGTDQSLTRAYQIFPTAGATGNVAMNQATLGGDAGRTLIVSFYERDEPTGTPTVDVYTDFENSTDGTTITTTIINAGTHPASPGGTWSEDLGGGSSNMTIENDAEKLFDSSRKVIANSVTYDDVGSTRGYKQAHDTQAGLAKFWRFTLTATSPLVSIGHYYRTNIDYGSFSSMTVNQVVDGGFAGLVALNWQDTEATFHTAYIENSLSETQPFAHILKDTWYWVTIQYDDVNNLGKVALYDPATWKQVGFTGTMRLGTTPGQVDQILLGQNGGGLASRAAGTLSYFDDFMIDFTTGQFPLLPGAAAGQTIAIGQASETDLAQAIAWAPKRRLVSPVAETDLAQSITHRKTKTLGQASETETAQPISVKKTRPLGQVTETDMAQALTHLKLTALGQTVETDLAHALTVRKTTTLGQVTETDLAQPVTPDTGGLVATVNSVLETDLAQAVSWAPKHRLVAQVNETDLAQACTSAKRTPVGQASETDLAQPITARKTRAIGQPAETDLAQSVTHHKTMSLGQTTETDLAQPVSVPGQLVVPVNQVTETDLAQSVAWAPKKRMVQQISETDQAQPVIARKLRVINLVTETDLAQPLGTQKIRGIGVASETDTALALAGSAKRKVLGQVGETDEALPIVYTVFLVEYIRIVQLAAGLPTGRAVEGRMPTIDDIAGVL